MAKDHIDYFKESEKYKPKIIKELLVGEAPPPSGKRYFYVPRPMSNNTQIEKDTSLPATIFHHYFKQRPETKEEYVEKLNKLKANGIFLMDIVDEPVKIRDQKIQGGINQENLKYLKNQIPKLRDKIKSRGISIDDERITFLLPRQHYKKELKEEFLDSKFIRWKVFRCPKE